MPADEDTNIFCGDKKPSKLTGEDDIVGYIRQLQIPLQEAVQTILDNPVAKKSLESEKPEKERASNESNLKKDENFSDQQYSIKSLDEESIFLIRRTLAEIKSKEASLASNKKCSSVMEVLLQTLSCIQVIRFGESLVPYLPFLAANRYSSHVLQTWLCVAFDYLSDRREIVELEEDEDTIDSDEEVLDSNQETLKVSRAKTASDVQGQRALLAKLVLNWLAEISAWLHPLIYNESGTHIVRALVGILSGLPTPALQISQSVDQMDTPTGGTKAKKSGPNRGKARAAPPALSMTAARARTQQYARVLGRTAYFGFREALYRLVFVLAHLGAGFNSKFRVSVADEPQFAAAEAVAATEALLDSQNTVEVSGGELASEELGAMSCDAHASPLLQQVIEAASVMLPSSAAFLCRRAINWTLSDLVDCTAKEDLSLDKKSKKKNVVVAVEDENNDKKSEQPPLHWLERLCQNATGSHLVECILRHCDAALFSQLLRQHFQGKLITLALNPASNFVLQRLLVSCPQPEQTEALVTELLPYIGTLYANRREGVVWHICAAVAGEPPKSTISSPSNGIGGGIDAQTQVVFAGHARPCSSALQASLLDALAAVSVLGPLAASAPVAQDELLAAESAKARKKLQQLAAEAEAERQQRVSLAAAQLRKSAVGGSGSEKHPSKGNSQLVRFLLDFCGERATALANGSAVPVEPTYVPLRSDSGANLAISIVGVRIIACLLRLEPAQASFLLHSLFSMPPDACARLCMDPNFSRHVAEPLVDGSAFQGGANDLTSWARGRLFSVLKGRFGELALSRFGCWVVSKTFSSVDVKKKAVIAEEMVGCERALAGAGPGGKAILRNMRLEHFKSNRSGWEASFSRSINAKDALNEILTVHSTEKKEKQKEKNRNKDRSPDTSTGKLKRDRDRDQDDDISNIKPKKDRKLEGGVNSSADPVLKAAMDAISRSGKDSLMPFMDSLGFGKKSKSKY